MNSDGVDSRFAGGGAVLVCWGGRDLLRKRKEEKPGLIGVRSYVCTMGRVTPFALHVVQIVIGGANACRFQTRTPLSKTCRSLPGSSCSFGPTAILLVGCRMSDYASRTPSAFHRPGASARETTEC